MTAKITRAKKTHRCVLCGNVIQPGTNYMDTKTQTISTGRWKHIRYCIECYDKNYSSKESVFERIVERLSRHNAFMACKPNGDKVWIVGVTYPVTDSGKRTILLKEWDSNRISFALEEDLVFYLDDEGKHL